MNATLHIVSMGPGDSAYLTPSADQALEAAQTVMGYRLYLDLLGQRMAGKRRVDFELGQERDRARAALAEAAAGVPTALVSSGDAGIYAMATLVFETIEQAYPTACPNVEVVPGISAMQLAAARAGAPLGHDFCAISLSDLLTPWAQIERRLRAAAEGDFVVALYNPVSRRRTWQLDQARDHLLAHRAPETPVVIARDLARADESVTHTTLEALNTYTVDMLTVVIVGNSQTRQFGGHIYTPRGYHTKESLLATDEHG